MLARPMNRVSSERSPSSAAGCSHEQKCGRSAEPVRRLGNRPPVKTILVVCEGLSEKVYFEQCRSRAAPVKIISVDARGGDYRKLLKTCRDKIKRYEISPRDGDIAAIVFDLDVYGQQDFDLLQQEEAAKSCAVLYPSNPSFEYWLLLHFHESDEKDQHGLIQELSEALGHDYEKSRGLDTSVTEEIIKQAVVRASKKIALDSKNAAEICMNCKPSTAAHLLTVRLMK